MVVYISAQKSDITVKNASSNMADKTLKKQSLDTFIIYDQDPVPSRWSRLRLNRTLNKFYQADVPNTGFSLESDGFA